MVLGEGLFGIGKGGSSLSIVSWKGTGTKCHRFLAASTCSSILGNEAHVLKPWAFRHPLILAKRGLWIMISGTSKRAPSAAPHTPC